MRAYAGIHQCLQKGSKLGLITSRMGSISDNTSGGMYGYRMSKCALNMFGKSLSVELKEAGIPVAIIHPGMVETDMTAVFGAKAGQGDCVSVETSAKGIIAAMDGLTLENTGTFQHAKGVTLPW